MCVRQLRNWRGEPWRKIKAYASKRLHMQNKLCRAFNRYQLIHNEPTYEAFHIFPLTDLLDKSRVLKALIQTENKNQGQRYSTYLQQAIALRLKAPFKDRKQSWSVGSRWERQGCQTETESTPNDEQQQTAWRGVMTAALQWEFCLLRGQAWPLAWQRVHVTSGMF